MGWLWTLLYYLHRSSYKKKKYLKYSILTLPLLWRDLRDSVKYKKSILSWTPFQKYLFIVFWNTYFNWAKKYYFILKMHDLLLKSGYPRWSPILAVLLLVLQIRVYQSMEPYLRDQWGCVIFSISQASEVTPVFLRCPKSPHFCRKCKRKETIALTDIILSIEYVTLYCNYGYIATHML